MILFMMGLGFLCEKKKKILAKLKRKTTFALICFVTKTSWFFQSIIQIKNLLLVTDENKSHYVYIKDFDRFMFYKTKHKNKNVFARVAYSVLVVKKY